jgi:hypothetical protein
MALAPDAPSRFVFEPPAFQLHSWSPDNGFVYHTVCGESFTGTFPFFTDPDYPGKS